MGVPGVPGLGVKITWFWLRNAPTPLVALKSALEARGGGGFDATFDCPPRVKGIYHPGHTPAPNCTLHR